MELLVKVVIAYLMGSIIGALWVGRFIGHVDIRSMGSGNAGGTNALRTQGWFFALLVVVVDVSKGALAAGWLPFLAIPWVQETSGQSDGWMPAACAAAAIVGHVFPVYHRFKGGKGAATLVGALLFLGWHVLLALLLTWLVVVSTTGYVGLATMLAVAAAAIYAGLSGGFTSALFAFMLAMTLFIAFTHRSNISRMRAGSENRMFKLMLFGRRSRVSGGE